MSDVEYVLGSGEAILQELAPQDRSADVAFVHPLTVSCDKVRCSI